MSSKNPVLSEKRAANVCGLLPVGISKITEEEANKLIHPTLAIPGTKDYLIQLDVWHELHCLNDLRMLLYPERYPGLAAVTNDKGVIDRESIEFRHWGTFSSISSPACWAAATTGYLVPNRKLTGAYHRRSLC